MEGLSRIFRAFIVDTACLGRKAVLVIAFGAVTLTGCAYMAAEGATRADAARALGMSPRDVVIVSREYDLPASGDAEYTLANYTVETSAGLTYTCDFDPPPPAQTITPHRTVCKRKP
jgi:hypothetical protein